MRLEEALQKHGGWEKLSDYERGWVQGVMAYSWMKDGQKFVGTTGKLLGDAVDEMLSKKDIGMMVVPSL